MKKKLIVATFLAILLAPASFAGTYTNQNMTMTLNGDMATITTSKGTESFGVEEVNKNCLILLDESNISANIYCFTEAGINPIFHASTEDELILQ